MHRDMVKKIKKFYGEKDNESVYSNAGSIESNRSGPFKDYFPQDQQNDLDETKSLSNKLIPYELQPKTEEDKVKEKNEAKFLHCYKIF